MKRRRPKTATTPSLAHRTLRIFVSALACIAFLITCIQLEARDRPKPKNSALIFGTVWSPDDLPVPGIKVKIRKASEKKARWELYSNRRGEFEQLVPAGPGDYVVWVETKGYKLPNGKRLPLSPEVTVHVNNDERVDTGVHLK